MNYELAKKLKDAGFSQNVILNTFVFPDGNIGKQKGVLPGDPEACRIPTLEELIEACGDKLIGLTRTPEVGSWVAMGEDDVIVEFMPTPTEAVARLWLVLNKK